MLTGPVYSERSFVGVTFNGRLNGWILGQKVSWSNTWFRAVEGGATWTQMAPVPNAVRGHGNFVSPTNTWIGAGARCT